MSNRLLLLAALLGSSLACTGVLPEESDTASVDTGVEADADDGPDEGVEQTSSCAEYMACIEQADPDLHDDLDKKYGEDGSCWQSTESKMRECDDECEDALDEAYEEHGLDYCDGEIDEDTGADRDCPIESGTWDLDLVWLEDTCDYGLAPSLWWEAECRNGTLTLVVGNSTEELECETAGNRFDCRVVVEGGEFEVSGSSSNGTTASGTLAGSSDGCFYLADFEGELE